MKRMLEGGMVDEIDGCEIKKDGIRRKREFKTEICVLL